MKEKVIAIFDVGKTKKKVLLFNTGLNIVSEEEELFPKIHDDDGFECDDISRIEEWVSGTVRGLAASDKYDLIAVNFATYGATLEYIDSEGKRLTPLYDYLKPIDDRIPEKVYRRHGGQDEFSRRTASPALGMLNSGMQALWLKYTKPQVFSRVTSILHFPQYLSYLLTGKVYSEHTSVGCHTALWDFDKMTYHKWIKEEKLPLPPLSDVGTINEVVIEGKKILVGIGIHDSSSSLAPYFNASNGKFVLISTGTWCINMNPFNTAKLTADQLDRDCLCYMSIAKQPVKSSRFFIGRLHEKGIEMLSKHFRTTDDHYLSVKPDSMLLEAAKRKSAERSFFFESIPYPGEFREKPDLYEFKSFEEGYHRLMVELTDLAVDSMKLVLPEHDDIENMYITGTFAMNPLFTMLISGAFPAKNVYTSEINDAVALGAALVIFDPVQRALKPLLNLGLTRC